MVTFSDAEEWHIVTFNTLTAVPEPLRFTGQRTRLKQMASLLSQFNQGKVDVFVLCECMIPPVYEDFLKPLADLGWPYCTRPLVSKNLTPALINGGVYILSKWPIEYEASHIYEASCIPDTLASKGVVYARIRRDTDSSTVHILGTHLQAWDDTAQRQTRLEQGREIRQFLEGLDLPVSEPVFLAGDLNICNQNHVEDFQQFLTITGFTQPPIRPFMVEASPGSGGGAGLVVAATREERYTVSKDNPLMGIDDPDRYTSPEWPNACEDIYLDTLRCVCCQPKWLDYVLISSRHKNPISTTTTQHQQRQRHRVSGDGVVGGESQYITILPSRVKTYSVPMNARIRRNVNYLSDHYPVLGYFRFSSSSSPSSQTFSSKSNKKEGELLVTKNQKKQQQQWRRKFRNWSLGNRHILLYTIVLIILLVGAASILLNNECIIRY